MVKGLSNYVDNNIIPNFGSWKINKEKYKLLESNEKINNNKILNTKNDDPLYIIIDGAAFYYYIAEKISWFNYDNIDFLNILRKELNYFLSIENLGKLIIIYDGVDPEIKEKAKNKRRGQRIKRVNKYYQKLKENDFKNNFKNDTLPSPLNSITLFQYIKDSMEIFDNLELKMTSFEADSYIAYLANKYNAYIISNDSDFFIYKVPEFINLNNNNSIIYPESIENECFEIKYQSYNNKQIYNHFGLKELKEEIMPIFGSLCGNDYIDLVRYNELRIYISNFKSSKKFESVNIIKDFYFKKVTIFLLQMNENIKQGNNYNNKIYKYQKKYRKSKSKSKSK
jgi:hypothetical protein